MYVGISTNMARSYSYLCGEESACGMVSSTLASTTIDAMNLHQQHLIRPHHVASHYWHDEPAAVSAVTTIFDKEGWLWWRIQEVTSTRKAMIEWCRTYDDYKWDAPSQQRSSYLKNTSSTATTLNSGGMYAWRHFQCIISQDEENTIRHIKRHLIANDHHQLVYRHKKRKGIWVQCLYNVEWQDVGYENGCKTMFDAIKKCISKELPPLTCWLLCC
jgi:hypothetical protein